MERARAEPGEFRTTTAELDLGRFLDLVAAEGMLAIVRPGPYICAEYDNGGLPAWLFPDPRIGVRRIDPRSWPPSSRYLRASTPIVVPRQIDHGGPVVLVQVENEYGAYGDGQRLPASPGRLTARRSASSCR